MAQGDRQGTSHLSAQPRFENLFDLAYPYHECEGREMAAIVHYLGRLVLVISQVCQAGLRRRYTTSAWRRVGCFDTIIGMTVI
jgi:hypothetical protein